MPIRSFLLTIRRLVALVVCAACALAAPVLASDPCGQPGAATLSSTTSFGLGSMTMQFDQRAFLQKVGSGPGFDGDWIVTEWSINTTLPMADPLSATRGGMTPVPEWMGTCSGKALSPTTFINECSGKIPLVISNGTIAWSKGGASIGRISPGAAGQPAQITLNILPNEGGFDWTMSGEATAPGGPRLDARIFAARNFSDTAGMIAGREYELSVTVTPATTQLVNTLTAGISHASAGSATMSALQTTPLGLKTTIRVFGPTVYSRKALTDTTSIDAATTLKGCDVSEIWALKTLISAAGYTP